jgi:hypothetical protein
LNTHFFNRQGDYVQENMPLPWRRREKELANVNGEKLRKIK